MEHERKPLTKCLRTVDCAQDDGPDVVQAQFFTSERRVRGEAKVFYCAEECAGQDCEEAHGATAFSDQDDDGAYEDSFEAVGCTDQECVWWPSSDADDEEQRTIWEQKSTRFDRQAQLGCTPASSRGVACCNSYTAPPAVSVSYPGSI